MELPPSWWVLTYLNHTRSWNELYVLAFTNFPDHLFMAWSHFKPTRKAIWKVVRGKDVFCGYKYIWDTPTIVEQNTPGDTLDHVWLLPRLESHRHIWYYLFAPLGPYGLEIQGPLVHVPPPEPAPWTTTLYAGTRQKGVFYTTTFTGPGGHHPIWQPSNAGLHSLEIWQLQPGPFGPQYRHYAIAGEPGDRKLYQRIPPVSSTWVPILTNAQACTLTGSADGILSSVTTNTYFPGYLYLLFNSALTTNGIWCLRSTDYGQSWQASQIYSGWLNYGAGNIMAGTLQGTSPHAPGTALYAPLTAGVGKSPGIWLSLDHGNTWTLKGAAGAGVTIPRCLVDPTDQSIIYTGALRTGTHPTELWRSEQHGDNLLEVDGDYHLGIFIDPIHGNLWINPTDHTFLINLRYYRLYTTGDYCLNWTQGPEIQHPATRLALLWENPQNLYLARHDSTPPAPSPHFPHVIFASDNRGLEMDGKAGAHANFPDGLGDSIPWDCGGLCFQGIMLFPPY